MPVNMDVPNSILSSYFQGLQIRQQKERSDADVADREAKNEEQSRQFNEQLKQATEFHRATQAHQQALLNLKQKEFEVGKRGIEAGLIEKYLSSGVRPQGTTRQLKSGYLDPNVGTPLPRNVEDWGQTQEDAVSPIGESTYRIPTQEEYAKIKAAPQIEAAKGIEAVRLPGRLELERAQAEANVARDAAKMEWEKEKQQNEFKNRKERAEANERLQRSLVAIRAAGKGKVGDNSKAEARASLIEDFKNFRLPIDAVPASSKEIYLSEAMKAGGYYTTQELDKVETAAKAISAMETMQQIFQEVSGKHPAKDKVEALGRWAKLTATGSDEAARFKTVAGLVAGLGRALGERGAFSNQDREIYLKAVVALDKSDTANAQAMKDLMGVFKRTAHRSLPNLKPEKRSEMIKNKFQVDINEAGSSDDDKPDPKQQIELDDGTRIPSTRANRRKYGLEK